MAYSKPHSPYSDLSSSFQARPTYQRKSCTYFICKFLLFSMFLAVLPLFPSEAPDFVNQTLITKFWELFHLLFVGIVVSYGLFSRRNVQVGIDETHSNFENQQPYLSKMFQFTSIFDEVEDLTASDGKKMNKSWHTRESRDDFSNFNRPHCSIPKKRYENSYEFADSDGGYAFKSIYTQNESVVLVGETNYSSGEWDVPGSVVNYKPLGLPIRSLRSNLTETEDIEFDLCSESGSVSKSSSNTSENCEFGDMNLEESFEEDIVSLSSPFQCRSKLVKNVMRHKVGNATRPSHFRPLSVDESQFESLKKSRSLHSTASHSSDTSSSSSSSTRKHRKLPSSGNISTKSSHSRHYSVHPLSEDSRMCSGDHPSDQENRSDCIESVASFTHSGRSFIDTPKAASRGKSVRTVRAKAVTTDGASVQEVLRNKVGNSSLENMALKKEENESLLADAEDNTESEGENIDESSEVEAESSAGDTESDAHEVDKKAGEFIAKFRQQIHLQKMASIGRSRGGSFSSTSSSYFS